MKAILFAYMMAGLAAGQQISFLGIGGMQVDAARAQQLKLPEVVGIEVTFVSKGSPAESAGLKSGDVITQYNGQRVNDKDQFVQMVQETPPGRQVKLQVYRAGAVQTITARIGAMTPANLAGGLPLPPRIPDQAENFQGWRSPVLGVEVQDVQGQLAQYFGVTEGVLVRSVTSGSAAARAGIKAGDVIIGIGSAKVITVPDITNRLQMLTGNSVGLQLMRDRQPVSLTVTFELQCVPTRGVTC